MNVSSDMIKSASQVAQGVKNSPAAAGDAGHMGTIVGSGRSHEGGNGDRLQYSCLENSMDRETWRTAVHRVAKRWTQLSTRARQ